MPSESAESFQPGSEMTGELEAKERTTFNMNLSKFTPRRLFAAAIETPVKLIYGTRESDESSAPSDKKYGSATAWFATGVVAFCMTMALINQWTAVPIDNFWLKSRDCPEGGDACNFLDVFCRSRNVIHQCTDPDEAFYSFFVDEVKKEISQLGKCGASKDDRGFYLSE